MTATNFGQQNPDEMFRTKYLVDKLSGKFQIDQKYLAIMQEDDRNYLMRKTGMTAIGSRFKLKPLDSDSRMMQSAGKEIMMQEDEFGNAEKQQ